jgi:hypothetical protein
VKVATSQPRELHLPKAYLASISAEKITWEVQFDEIGHLDTFYLFQEKKPEIVGEKVPSLRFSILHNTKTYVLLDVEILGEIEKTEIRYTAITDDNFVIFVLFLDYFWKFIDHRDIKNGASVHIY